MRKRDESAGQRADEAQAQIRYTGSPRVRLSLAVVALLVAAVPALAFADEEASSPSSELPADALQQAVAASDTSEVQLTDPQAAEELPHSDLGRAEALDLNEAVFGVVLKSAAGPGQDLEVEKYLSDNAAVISIDSQPGAPLTAGVGEAVEESPLPASTEDETVLLDSTTPLRTEGPDGSKEPISLGLEMIGDHLEPESPLVQLEVPRELGDGIVLPDSGVQINLANAHQSVAPSLVGDTVATYPNVADDTDFSAVPVPAGVETLTTLRSAEAPDEQKYDLTLPSGATLRQDEKGAKVVRGDETLLRILPPSAIDANGENVPATLDVSGSSFTVAVSPGPETAYPLLVDPLYEDHDWNVTHEVGQASWKNQMSPGANMWLKRYPEEFYMGAYNGFQPANSQTGVTYSVPRLSEEEAAGRTPNSYIAGLTVWHIGLWNAGSNPGYSPYLFSGIWGGEGHWAGKPGKEAVWVLPGNSPNAYMNPGWGITLKNGTPAEHDGGAKVAWGLGMATQENTTLAWTRQGDLGAAAVEVGDENKPGIANPNVLPWQDAVAKGIVQATAEDAGLGVKVLNFRLPGQAVATNVVNPCLGTAANPCPYKWTAQLPTNQASPANLPQGYNYVSITSEDVLGNQSPTPAKAMIPVDHSSPKLEVSGSITEQGALGTIAPEYKLTYNARDGDTAAAAALTPFGGAGTAEGKTQGPVGIASTSTGNVFVVDRDNTRVEKFDATGKFLKQFGSLGSAKGQFSSPRGIAISPSGGVWVADTENNRIEQFNEAGEFVSAIGKDVNKTKVEAAGTEAQKNLCTAASGNICQAGTVGSLNGQFKGPRGLAFTAGGNLIVADTGNDRIQKLSATGEYLAKFGSTGTGAGQLKEPYGVAVASDGSFAVADRGNNRIALWSSTFVFIRQFGAYGAGEGQMSEPTSLAITPSGHILVTDSGNHRVLVFQPTGRQIRQFASYGTGGAQVIEPRAIALGSNGTTYLGDAGNHRVTTWSHADLDPQAGVSKVEIKVDGKLESTPYNQACASDSCTSSATWPLKASSYASGSHKVEVIATDGVTAPATKTLNITTTKDTTPPQIIANSEFFTAPDGWLEQKNYTYSANAKDPSGYGVSSMILKLDGKIVNSLSQACPNGGCERVLSGSINMATYDGGAHPAELITTDGAGLVTKTAWTVNVNPSGTVPVSEATDTIEAADETANSIVVAPTSEVLEPEQIEPGDNPGLKVNGTSVTSTGTSDVTEMTTNPSDGFVIHTPNDNFEVTPVVNEAAADLTVAAGVAGVVSDIRSEVDSVVRPEYNGLLTFQSIRAVESPETFSWTVKLWPGQQLVAAEDQHAEVLYPDGETAMLISAEAAHDATGVAVPTSLAVSGNTVTLMVSHRSKAYVYPVVAGQAFEVGASSVTVTAPPPPPLIGGEGEVEDPGGPTEPTPPAGSNPKEHPLWTLRYDGTSERWYAPAPSFSRPVNGVIHPFYVEDRSNAGRDKWYIQTGGHYIKRQLIRLSTTIQKVGGPGCNGEIGTGALGFRYLAGGAIDGADWFGPEIVETDSGEHLGVWCHYRLTSWPIWNAVESETVCSALQAWVYANGWVKKLHRKWVRPYEWCPSAAGPIL